MHKDVVVISELFGVDTLTFIFQRVEHEARATYLLLGVLVTRVGVLLPVKVNKPGGPLPRFLPDGGHNPLFPGS